MWKDTLDILYDGPLASMYFFNLGWMILKAFGATCHGIKTLYNSAKDGTATLKQVKLNK